MSPKNEQQETKQEVVITSFTSPIDYYDPNRLNRDYSTALDGLSNVLGTFSAGEKAPEMAGKAIQFLNSKDSDGNTYLGVCMKSFKDAKMGFNATGKLPTVEEVLRVAKYTYIVEKDGTISNYADKFFANDSVDAMLKDGSISSQELGSLMAIHMAMFMSKTPFSPIKGIEEAFGDINPGTTDGREPLRVYVTVPGHSAAAIAGSDFTKAYATSKEETEKSFSREINKQLDGQAIYESNKEKWEEDIAGYEKSIARDKKAYEDAQKKLEETIAENEKKYSEWEKTYNEKYPDDEALKKDMEETERKKLHDWTEQQDEEEYGPRNKELEDKAKEYTDELRQIVENPVKIPPEPVETNIFRRLWVLIGGGHSEAYKQAERVRATALEEKQEQDAVEKSLKEEMTKLSNKMRDLAQERDNAIEAKRLEIEEDIKKLPDPKTVREEEIKRQKKELLEDPKQKLTPVVEEAKKTYEDCQNVLGAEIERLKKLLSGAAMDFEKQAADMTKKQEAFQNKEKMQGLVEKITAAANKTATELMKRSERRQRHEINERLKNEDMSELVMSSKVDTLAPGSVTAIVDTAAARLKMDKRMEQDRKVNGIHASEILATQDTEFLQKASKEANAYANKAEIGSKYKKPDDAKKEKFYELCLAEYNSKKDIAVKAFEDTFNIRCNPGNVQLVIDQLNIKEYTEYAVKNVDGKNVSEHPFPKVNKNNFKDMAYLTMTGLKSAMILQANKGDVEIAKDVKSKDVQREEVNPQAKLKSLPAGPAL